MVVLTHSEGVCKVTCEWPGDAMICGRKVTCAVVVDQTVKDCPVTGHKKE